MGQKITSCGRQNVFGNTDLLTKGNVKIFHFLIFVF